MTCADFIVVDITLVILIYLSIKLTKNWLTALFMGSSLNMFTATNVKIPEVEIILIILDYFILF